MPAGLGIGPVGMSVFGYGGVDLAPVQQQTILIDADSGTAQNSRRIDPATGRYVLDTYGRVEGMSGVAQLVMMRAGNLLNSTAVRGLGLRAPSGIIGTDILRRLEDEVRVAMKDILDGGLIQIVGVFIDRPVGGPVRRYFLWRDLTTQNEQETSF